MPDHASVERATEPHMLISNAYPSPKSRAVEPRHHREAAYHHQMVEHDDVRKHPKGSIERGDILSKATSFAQVTSHK
jgi:hypothetical protein